MTCSTFTGLDYSSKLWKWDGRKMHYWMILKLCWSQNVLTLFPNHDKSLAEVIDRACGNRSTAMAHCGDDTTLRVCTVLAGAYISMKSWSWINKNTSLLKINGHIYFEQNVITIIIVRYFFMKTCNSELNNFLWFTCIHIFGACILSIVTKNCYLWGKKWIAYKDFVIQRCFSELNFYLNHILLCMSSFIGMKPLSNIQYCLHVVRICWNFMQFIWCILMQY